VVGGLTAGTGLTGFVVGTGLGDGFTDAGGLTTTGSGFSGGVGRIGSGLRGGGVTLSTVRPPMLVVPVDRGPAVPPREIVMMRRGGSLSQSRGTTRKSITAPT
jgi:hypothetical protein